MGIHFDCVEKPRGLTMAIAQCPRCDQVFNKVSSLVCAKCAPDEEAEYARVREVMEDMKEHTSDQLAKEAGVEVECVLRMLEQGLIANVADRQVKCGRCGAPAISAVQRLCAPCLGKLETEVAKAKKHVRASQPRGQQDDKTVHKTIDAKRR